jgi:hypothetical protein
MNCKENKGFILADQIIIKMKLVFWGLKVYFNKIIVQVIFV